MIIYTKESLIAELKAINEQGWIDSCRGGNCGSIGNTLEDLLGIEENNLPIPNAAEWELKTQRLNTTALVTLFRSEPSPRAIKFVPQLLLPYYGWKHENAKKKYPENELSFRQTISCKSTSDRGFQVQIDRAQKKILISFDSTKVSDRHSSWLANVEKNIGLKQLDPQPYWGFDDLFYKAGTKLLNCFFVQAEVKKDSDKYYYRYSKVQMLQKFSFEGFLRSIEIGNVLIDFDARTGHNHGTKFRMRQNCLPDFYEDITNIIG